MHRLKARKAQAKRFIPTRSSRSNKTKLWMVLLECGACRTALSGPIYRWNHWFAPHTESSWTVKFRDCRTGQDAKITTLSRKWMRTRLKGGRSLHVKRDG